MKSAALIILSFAVGQVTVDLQVRDVTERERMFMTAGPAPTRVQVVELNRLNYMKKMEEHGQDFPAWSVDADCWKVVYETCRAYEKVRSYTMFMTGPGETLKIRVPAPSLPGQYKFVAIQPKELWLIFGFDYDDDGDIDLKDWHFMLNEKSSY